ncbi:MAG: zinc ABC transporter substrate-binding protein [Eubacteriales bacterium]
MKINKTILMGIAMMMFLLVGCSNETETSDVATSGVTESVVDVMNSNEKLNVVTTIFPEYDWTREVLGENIENVNLTMLLDNGVDLHSYQPTVDDIIAISECDLFIYVGGESDYWVEDALKNATNPDMKVLNLMELLGDLTKMEELVEGMQASEHDHDHSHDHGELVESEIEDRPLSDFTGSFKSVYPLLLEGEFEDMFRFYEESDDFQTYEEVVEYWDTGLQSEYTLVDVDDKSVTFSNEITSVTAEYEAKGYVIVNYGGDENDVWYQYEAVGETNGAPKYIVLDDHGWKQAPAEHFHIYGSDISFEHLAIEVVDKWPTYFKTELSESEMLMESFEHFGYESHDHEEHSHADEHVWLSLRNAELITLAIAQELALLDSENETLYHENAEHYVISLRSLDKEYQETVDASEEKMILVCDRFPFRYLVDDYGIDYYAAFSGCSAETEASFETIAFLAEKLDELNMSTVLTIESREHKIAETVIESTQNKNQEIKVLNSMQAISSNDVQAGITYLSIMEENLQVLKEVLE